jgi:hypothetical protein
LEVSPFERKSDDALLHLRSEDYAVKFERKTLSVIPHRKIEANEHRKHGGKESQRSAEIGAQQ